MTRTISIPSLDALDAAAAEFLSIIGERKLIAFYAPMGAGKTTFTTAVCKALGVRDDAVSSPTFSIVNEYRCADGAPLYHFDFYRLNNVSEALDIGCWDYFDSGELCMMEWPENIESILPEETLKVFIKVLDDGGRVLEFDI